MFQRRGINEGQPGDKKGRGRKPKEKDITEKKSKKKGEEKTKKNK